MKWIVALLIIANVVVYLWLGQRQDAENTVINAKFDVNKEGMLMLSEIGDLKQIGHIGDSQQPVSELVGLNQTPTDTTATDVATSVATQTTTQTTAQDIVDKVPTPTASVQTSYQDTSQDTPRALASCYRLGPFKRQENWQVATQWMTQNEIEFRHVTSESRELKAVRIYLGPYPAVSAAEPTIRLLKSKNLEHFVYPVEEGVNISLGYFTQPELAEKFLAHLQSLNVQAKSQHEYRQLGPFNWLVIPVDSAKAKQAINHDWAESAVRSSQIEC